MNTDDVPCYMTTQSKHIDKNNNIENQTNFKNKTSTCSYTQAKRHKTCVKATDNRRNHLLKNQQTNVMGSTFSRKSNNEGKIFNYKNNSFKIKLA